MLYWGARQAVRAQGVPADPYPIAAPAWQPLPPQFSL